MENQLSSIERSRNVPKLRFSEFEDEWCIQRLKDISKIYDGTHQTPKYVNQGIPFYSVEHITSNQFEKTKYISEEVFQKENKRVKLEKGDILMTRIGSIGVSKYIDWDVNASFYVSLALIKKKSEYNSKYLNQFINSCFFQKELWKRTIHVAFPKKINLGEIGECLAVLPSLPEQKKIASFLTDVGDKITKLTKKKDLLVKYKKGIMQKIFNQELRFKDDEGNEFPEWEEKKLGEVSDVRDGTHDSPKYVKQGYPLITSKNLTSNGKLDFSDISFISELDYININKRSRVDIGDIIFGMIGTIGNPVLLKENGFAIKNVALIKEKEELQNVFLIHYLKSNHILKQFHVENSGGTQKFVALGVIRNLKILAPSIREQTKIANFLSDIDLKIEAINTKIENSKTFKKGLLQQMFV